MEKILKDLASFLENNEEKLIDDWRKAFEKDDELKYVSRLTGDQFRDNIPDAIKGLCENLRSDSGSNLTQMLRENLSKHGHHRWRQGFSLRQLIRDWGIFHQTLSALVENFIEMEEERKIMDARKIIHDYIAKFITEATSDSIKRYDELRKAEAASLTKDISKMKENFESLTQARGAMLREAVHDLKGNLTAVKMITNIVQKNNDEGKSITDSLDSLDNGVNSVKQMLDSLLDLSRLEAGADKLELMEVNISPILEDLIKEFRKPIEDKGLSLHFDAPVDLFVYSDPEKIVRITQNLLVNAMQHTTKGEISIQLTSDNRSWTLVVKDTGPGIQDITGSPISQEMDSPIRGKKTWDLSKSDPYEGEGIGMTIVKRLCSLMDAGVLLDSELTKGTVITINFPMIKSI